MHCIKTKVSKTFLNRKSNRNGTVMFPRVFPWGLGDGKNLAGSSAKAGFPSPKRWLLTFQVCFFRAVTNMKQGFVILSDNQSGPNKTHISACLAGFITTFSLHRLWPLTDLTQVGVFKGQWWWNWCPCRDYITDLKDTNGTEESTPSIIIIPMYKTKNKKLKMSKIVLKFKCFKMFILMPICIA